MKPTETHPIKPALLHASWFAPGCLMSPLDVQTALGGRALPEFASWTLCGEVPDLRRLFPQSGCSQSGLLELARVARTPSGHQFLLVVHQVAAWQHRWILSMQDPLVRACLEAVASGRPLRFALVGESDKTYVWRSEISAVCARSMLARCESRCSASPEPSEDEFSQAAYQLCLHGALESMLPGVEVLDVSVTAIRPEQT